MNTAIRLDIETAREEKLDVTTKKQLCAEVFKSIFRKHIRSYVFCMFWKHIKRRLAVSASRAFLLIAIFMHILDRPAGWVDHIGKLGIPLDGLRRGTGYRRPFGHAACGTVQRKEFLED